MRAAPHPLWRHPSCSSSASPRGRSPSTTQLVRPIRLTRSGRRCRTSTSAGPTWCRTWSRPWDRRAGAHRCSRRSRRAASASSIQLTPEALRSEGAREIPGGRRASFSGALSRLLVTVERYPSSIEQNFPGPAEQLEERDRITVERPASSRVRARPIHPPAPLPGLARRRLSRLSGRPFLRRHPTRPPCPGEILASPRGCPRRRSRPASARPAMVNDYAGLLSPPSASGSKRC